MPPIRRSSSKDTLLSELDTKIKTAVRKARPKHYYVKTHQGNWLHHIESLCSSCGITWEAWSRLAVIQLRSATRRWWESIGQDLNLVYWRGFRRNIMEHFVGPFLYRKTMVDSTYAQGRCFFTQAVGWAPRQGESMQEYRHRFEEDFLAECPYKLRQEDACELFWQGVPHKIRALVYFPRPYPDYDHLCLEVIYAKMYMRAERVDTPPIGGLEDAEDASSHVEVPVPHQPKAVGDDDTRIDPEEEDPTEVFIEGEDGETDGPRVLVED
ncbi:hypothetical protein TIFTF001_037355 [Ficus carica]|uniref:Retrotransposon gag domain-containing protein n=1 Tax=Ficus carica TaxID=3494 RepID=A0AA88J8U3_FICCA|nr:hypothetical protein TIFTF001_037355 [Ficus carica]